VSSLKLAGPALYGTYGVADYAEQSSEASKNFGKSYREAYKTAPDLQSAWTYDAVNVLSAAINKAGSTDPGKIREAILGLKKFPGAEGEYNFDQNGDGLHGYNVVRNDKGTIVFDKHIEFED
jgi:branched-chain amino acid transport system substrate-binding protein